MHHLHRMIVFSLLGKVQYLSCCLILYQATALITMSILGTLKFSVLVVHFVIWQKCGSGSEHFCEEVVWDEECTDASSPCHASQISQCTAPNTSQYFIW